MNCKVALSRSLILVVLATLAACGGSGSGSTSSNAPPPDNAGTAPPPDNSNGTPRPGVAGLVYVANRYSGNVSGYTIDASTGVLHEVAGSPFAAGNLPSALAVDPSGTYLCVTNTDSDDVSIFTIDADTGVLASAGSVWSHNGPHSIAFDPSGRFAYVANYGTSLGDGDISGYTVDPQAGPLLLMPRSPFPAGPTPHSVTVDAAGKFLYQASASQYNDGYVTTFSINPSNGDLRGLDSVTTGADPQDVALHPSGKFAYVANAGSRISAYAINPSTGTLAEIAGSPFIAGDTPGFITIDTAGRFLYATNLVSENVYGTVSVYAIDSTTGALSEIPGSPFAAGWRPKALAIHPSGKFAYVPNSEGSSISAYTIDAATGALTRIGFDDVAAGIGPQSVRVDPSGRVAYVDNNVSNDISAYTINTTTGALTSIGTVPAGMSPGSLTITGIR